MSEVSLFPILSVDTYIGPLPQHYYVPWGKYTLGIRRSSSCIVHLRGSPLNRGVVYLPSTRPEMPFQRRGSCIFHWCRRAWLTIWNNVKYHGTVRLMHRKRATCELHDSYFRLMTIKHVIPRTAEVTHPDGQLWGDIEWAIELLYNSVKTGSQLVWRPDPLVKRCGRESQHPAEWPPSPPVEQHRKNGKETLMAIGVGVNMLQFCSVSNSLSHTNLSNKVRGIFF